MTDNAERRVLQARDLRLVGNPAHPRIEGYAAIFGEPSEDLGGFVELIRPGAFARTIQEDDVRALFNHDPNYVLGRNTSGTLRLREDGRGLFFSVRPPATTWAQDLLTSIKRGDVTGMSFGFDTIRDSWRQIEGLVKRTLLEVKLFDVGPVTFPAYPQTSAQVRAKAERLGRQGLQPRWQISDLEARRRQLEHLEAELDPADVEMGGRRLELKRLEESL